jgi:hypothetical protein
MTIGEEPMTETTDLADLVVALATESLDSGDPPMVLAERVDFSALTSYERHRLMRVGLAQLVGGELYRRRSAEWEAEQVEQAEEAREAERAFRERVDCLHAEIGCVFTTHDQSFEKRRGCVESLLRHVVLVPGGTPSMGLPGPVGVASEASREPLSEEVGHGLPVGQPPVEVDALPLVEQHDHGYEQVMRVLDQPVEIAAGPSAVVLDVERLHRGRSSASPDTTSTSHPSTSTFRMSIRSIPCSAAHPPLLRKVTCSLSGRFTRRRNTEPRMLSPSP